MELPPHVVLTPANRAHMYEDGEAACRAFLRGTDFEYTDNTWLSLDINRKRVQRKEVQCVVLLYAPRKTVALFRDGNTWVLGS